MGSHPDFFFFKKRGESRSKNVLKVRATFPLQRRRHDGNCRSTHLGNFRVGYWYTVTARCLKKTQECGRSLAKPKAGTGDRIMYRKRWLSLSDPGLWRQGKRLPGREQDCLSPRESCQRSILLLVYNRVDLRASWC